MSSANNFQVTGLVASGTLTQFKVVKFASTAGAVVQVTATTDAAIGILQNDPTNGQAAEIVGLGECRALAGVNDLAAGEFIGFNSTGNVVDHTTDNRRIIGRTMQASTGIGDEVLVFLSGLSRY